MASSKNHLNLAEIGGAEEERKPGSSKWRFVALRFVHSQDIRDIRGPNAFKTRLKCTCHEIALSVTRQTCTWRPPTKHAETQTQEGVNREKLTVKKIINNEILFLPFMSLINREKLCVNREKIGTKNPPFLHRWFSPFTSSWQITGVERSKLC